MSDTPSRADLYRLAYVAGLTNPTVVKAYQATHGETILRKHWFAVAGAAAELGLPLPPKRTRKPPNTLSQTAALSEAMRRARESKNAS